MEYTARRTWRPRSATGRRFGNPLECGRRPPPPWARVRAAPSASARANAARPTISPRKKRVVDRRPRRCLCRARGEKPLAAVCRSARRRRRRDRQRRGGKKKGKKNDTCTRARTPPRRGRAAVRRRERLAGSTVRINNIQTTNARLTAVAPLSAGRRTCSVSVASPRPPAARRVS